MQGGYQAILSLGFVDFTESLDFELVRFGQARFIDALEWIVSHRVLAFSAISTNHRARLQPHAQQRYCAAERVYLSRPFTKRF